MKMTANSPAPMHALKRVVDTACRQVRVPTLADLKVAAMQAGRNQTRRGRARHGSDMSSQEVSICPRLVESVQSKARP